MNIDTKIFCIIPSYNEQDRIKKTILDVKKIIKNIVVIDDGSSDKIYERAKETGVTVLRHVINRGQGAALQTGNKFAYDNGAEIAVHFDADGQFLANEIPRLLKPLLRNECDISLGSRFIEGASKMPWTKKYILFPIARLVNYVLLGVKLTDPQSGFRALNRKAMENIVIEQDGSAHCSEILYKANINKLKIKEAPMTVIYNEYGQSLFKGKGRKKGGIQIIKDLLLAKIMQ
ncbi:glycosyltransferase family 2 protein [Candidatus Parcubacteria bacterium]|nr:glycosyltransferase family 2 protein [Candidatus Parcubacteria bacterium]